MTSRHRTDKTLECSTCGDVFVFSAGEQELNAIRGVEREPQHCPSCVRAREHLLTAHQHTH